MAAEVGSPAPDFSLQDTDGKSYGLADALGRGPVLLVFFKTTCGTCDLAFPYVNRMKEAYPGEGWSLWAVAQDPAAEASRYASSHGIGYPVLPDSDGYPVSRAFDPPATPTLFLIAGSGEIIGKSEGFSKEDLNSLSGALAGLVGAKATVVAEADDGNPDFKPG